jgi:ubiquinone/menaquinone biosynthesis C-methylase UbiE
MSNPTTFDQFASDYDATVQAAIGASGESVAYFAALKARLARSEAPASTRRVLDFGCGIGNTSRALAAAMPVANIIGCDPSSDSIAVARRRSNGSVEFARSDETRLPFDDASFDLVVAACVFHHIERARQRHWVAEIARVLRPGGRFVLFEHNPLNPLTQRVVRSVPFDAGVVLLGRKESRRLLQSVGLRTRRSRYYFFFPRFLAALRMIEPILGWLPMGGQYYVVGER